MNSDDLSQEQIKSVMGRIEPILHYLRRLQDRMIERGFDDEDPMFRRAKAAHSEVLGIFSELHHRKDYGIYLPAARHGRRSCKMESVRCERTALSELR